MSKIENYYIREKYGIHIPKNLLRGSASIFVQDLNTNSTARDIVNMIEDERVKVLDLYLIPNKTSEIFTGLAKVVLLGNNTLNK